MAEIESGKTIKRTLDENGEDYDENGKIKPAINLNTAIQKFREKKFEYETLDRRFEEYISEIKYKKAMKRKQDLIIKNVYSNDPIYDVNSPMVPNTIEDMKKFINEPSEIRKM